MGLFKRGSYETSIHSLTFDPSEQLLLMNTGQESIHIFDIYDTFSKYTGNRTWKTKALSQFSKIWSGEQRSRFILEKPQQRELSIVFYGDDLLLVSKSGDYCKMTGLNKILEEMAEKGRDKEAIELNNNLLVQDGLLANTTSN